jgi:hypothetical protein
MIARRDADKKTTNNTFSRNILSFNNGSDHLADYLFMLDKSGQFYYFKIKIAITNL